MPCVSVGGNGINRGEVTQVVTRDTRWPAGTPCWGDVSVDDVPKAIAFYHALFGWDIQAGGPDVGGYAIAHHHGRIVAGLGPKFGPPDAPSAWTTYLAADDADAVAEKIKAAGSSAGVPSGYSPMPPTSWPSTMSIAYLKPSPLISWSP